MKESNQETKPRAQAAAQQSLLSRPGGCGNGETKQYSTIHIIHCSLKPYGSNQRWTKSTMPSQRHPIQSQQRLNLIGEVYAGQYHK